MANEDTEKKPGVKIQDLSPKKDAKGGAVRNPNAMNPNAVNPNAGGGADQNALRNPNTVDTNTVQSSD